MKLISVAFACATLLLCSRPLAACDLIESAERLSPEQKLASAPVIFIGKVVKISGGWVTFRIAEMLRGPKMKTFRVRQGQTDCSRVFRKNTWVLYGGDWVTAATTEFDGLIPESLGPAVMKLRAGQPLDPAPGSQ